MECEICQKSPLSGGPALHRINEFGVKGVWRCFDCLTPLQRRNLDAEVLEIVRIIEGEEE